MNWLRKVVEARRGPHKSLIKTRSGGTCCDRLQVTQGRLLGELLHQSLAGLCRSTVEGGHF